MKILFAKESLKDYRYWEANDKKIFERINRLIRGIKDSPFKGLGKPEPLKQNLSGYWSRRITHEHRLVYKISGKGENKSMIIIQCKYHY